MKVIKKILQKNAHIFASAALLPVLIWFKYLENEVVARYDVHIFLDDWIPFIPIFVIPYLTWFAYVLFGIVYTCIKSRREYYRLLIFLGGGMFVAYFIYSLFPNGQHLRPTVLGNDVFSRIIAFIYATDTPTNVFPSIHVINSIAVNSALQQLPDFKKSKVKSMASSILMVLICMSTVFIKQHSVADVMGGIVTAIAFYIPIYKSSLMGVRKNCKSRDMHSEWND